MFDNPIKPGLAAAASAAAPASPLSPQQRIGVPPAPAGGRGRDAVGAPTQFVRPLVDRINAGAFKSQPVSRRRSEDSDFATSDLSYP
jgi:hypothetical protein